MADVKPLKLGATNLPEEMSDDDRVAAANVSSTIPTNAQTGTAYTAVASDAGKRIVMSNAAANTVTLDASLYSVGDGGLVQPGGNGPTTLVAAEGTTLFPAAVTATTKGQMLFWLVDSATQITVGP